MDITTLAAWGEFIGGIAVVVSLIYLASQIRQNSRLMRASTTASTNQILATLPAMLAEQPEVSRIWWDGCSNRASLSEEDRRRFDPLVTLYFHAVRQQFQFQRDGVGSPEEWAFQLEGMTFVANQPGVREWWRDYGGPFPEEFRKIMERLIREGEATG